MDMLTVQQLAASVLAVALVSGCSTSATLTLRNGRLVRGPIVRSDATTVWVEQGGSARRVERKNIADVSHPGSGEILCGGMFLALAAFLVIEADAAAHERHQDASCSTDCRTSGLGDGGETVGAAVFGVAGLSIAAFGLGAYSGSRSAYALPEAPAPPTPKQGAKGVRLGFEF
jgi:hypothetical protein